MRRQQPVAVDADRMADSLEHGQVAGEAVAVGVGGAEVDARWRRPARAPPPPCRRRGRAEGCARCSGRRATPPRSRPRRRRPRSDPRTDDELARRGGHQEDEVAARAVPCDARPRLRVDARRHVHGDDLAGEIAGAVRTRCRRPARRHPRTASWICTSSNPNRLNRACMTSEWNIARVGMKPARRIGRATCSIDEPRSRVRSTSKNAAARRVGWSCSATMREMSRVASRSAGSSRSSVGATAAELLSDAEARIAASRNIEHWQPGLARWDAEVLLAHRARRRTRRTTGLRSMPVTASQRRRFEAMVERRLTGEPVNYITGRFRFCGLDLTVRPGVFSPRASSEFTVELAAARLRRRRGRRVAVDVATGAGAIALALGVRGAGRRGVGRGHLVRRGPARHGSTRAAWSSTTCTSPRRHARRAARRPCVARCRCSPSIRRTSRARRCARSPWRSAASSRGTRSPTARRTGSGMVRRLGVGRPGVAAHRAATCSWRSPRTWRATPPPCCAAAGLRDVRSHRDSLGVTRVVIGQL